MKKLIPLILILPFILALTVTDTVTPGRVVDGNLVSDAVEDGEQPIFGNVLGSGSTTITWAQVTVDANGDPVTIKNYELRYRAVGSTEYTLVVVPSEFTGYATTLSAGNYEGTLEAVTDTGYVSATAGTLNFTVN